MLGVKILNSLMRIRDGKNSDTGIRNTDCGYGIYSWPVLCQLPLYNVQSVNTSLMIVNCTDTRNGHQSGPCTRDIYNLLYRTVLQCCGSGSSISSES